MNKIHISSLAVFLALTTSGCKDETQTAEIPPSAPKAETAAATSTQPTAEEGLIPTPEQQPVAQPTAEEELIPTPAPEPTPEPEPVPALVKAGGPADVQHPYYAQLQHEREKYAAPTEGKHPLTSNLYNGEQVTLPDWLYDELADVNARLREKLTPSDYLQVLKGVQELLGHVKTKNMLQAHINKTQDSSNTLYWYPDFGPNLNQPENLLAKLEQICQHPENDFDFARPRYLPPETDGVIYNQHLRYAPGEINFANDRYVVNQGAGLSLGVSGLWHFWDARTCRLQTRFAVPTLVHPIPENACSAQEHFFKIDGIVAEAGGHLWNSTTYGSYILSPAKYELQSFLDCSAVGVPSESTWQGNGLLLARTPWLGTPVAGTDTWENREDTAKRPEITDPLRCPSLPTGGAIIPYQQNSFVAWGYAGAADYVQVDLHTLATHRGKTETPEELEARKNQVKKAVVPAFISDGSEAELTDISNTCEGYTLFQYNGGSYYGTSSSMSVMGLLTPTGEAMLFASQEENRPWFLDRMTVRENKNFLDCIPASGRLIPYAQAIQKYTDENLCNIKDACSYMFSPAIREWRINMLPEAQKAEIFMSLKVEEGVECSFVLEMNLEDYTYRVVKSWQHGSFLLPAVWIPEKSLFLKPEPGNCYAVLKVADGQEDAPLANMYIDVHQGYAIVLPDGRYAGSPGCESFLCFGDGKQVLSMQALAPWRNRPGEVLESLEGNPDDIAALKQTTKRWLKKQGFDPDAMPEEPKLNEFPVAEVEMPNLIAEQNSVSFKVKLRATARDIVRLDVRADGELLAQPSIQPDETAMGEREVTVTVPLATGQNWIEVTPVDAAGISGDSQKFRVIYKGKYESDLYVVALGVSDYDNDELDLNYAAKDARDLVASLEKYTGSRVRSLVLTDKEVTGAKVLDTIKGFLAGTTPDDRVVFYVAGHGMLDADLEYHYAPATFDPNRVKETGISMEAFTECMRACKARKRLLLLDTCHSGQLGEADEEKLAMLGVQLPHGVRAIQNRGMKVKKAKIELSETQTKRYMEDIFTLGSTERGINIIAGAAGAEFALESGEWNNGVFTASIIKCLNGEVKADANDDKTLTVEELQMAVQDSVFALTGGRQKPSVVSAEDAYNFSIAIRDSKESTQAPENTQNSDSGGQVMTITEQINPPAPTMEVEDRSSLDPLIARMAALRCKHATSKLYQQRLLTLLPLIRQGYDVNTTLPETKGNTALHYSCAIGSLSITKWLLEHGANPNAVTDKGATPLQCVGADNGPQIRKLLKQYGAVR